MKKVIRLNENDIEKLVKKILREDSLNKSYRMDDIIFEKKEEKFIQKAQKDIKKRGTEGSFREYCGGSVTKECIEKGLRSKNPSIVKKANYAKNIKGYKGAKLFENFDDYKETEFNKFRTINISDIQKFTFFWSNVPSITDYQMSNGEYGDPEKRIDISHEIRSILSNVTKGDFRKILEKNFKVEIRSTNSPSIESESPSYYVELKGQDVIAFFDILENIAHYEKP